MDQISFDDLFNENTREKTSHPHSSSPLKNAIVGLLESGISSALEICECLIDEGKVSKERYSTNKPKAYLKVCSILDELVLQEKVILVEERTKKIGFID